MADNKPTNNNWKKVEGQAGIYRRVDSPIGEDPVRTDKFSQQVKELRSRLDSVIAGANNRSRRR